MMMNKISKLTSVKIKGKTVKAERIRSIEILPLNTIIIHKTNTGTVIDSCNNNDIEFVFDNE